jgi:hypothetical protein
VFDEPSSNKRQALSSDAKGSVAISHVRVLND